MIVRLMRLRYRNRRGRRRGKRTYSGIAPAHGRGGRGEERWGREISKANRTETDQEGVRWGHTKFCEKTRRKETSRRLGWPAAGTWSAAGEEEGGGGSGARKEAGAGRRRRDGEVVGVRRGVAEAGGKTTAARSRKHPRQPGELNQNLTLL